MSTVSIIIPNYNGAKYLNECLESCLKQRKYIKDIIIVDDESTDNSWEIIESYNLIYPHIIKGIKNENKGACSARNLGYKHSSGKYIQWLDSDDFLGENKLHHQILDISKNDSKISVCETLFFFDGEDFTMKKKNPAEQFFLNSENRPDYFLARLYGGVNGKGSMVANSAWLTPRVVVERAGLWNESLLKDQDGEFFSRVLLHSNGIIYNSKVFAYYRKFKNGSNIVNNKTYEYSRSYLDALHLKAKHLLSYSNLLESRKGIARLYLEAAILYFPFYKDLSAEAEQHYRQFNFAAPVPVIGGRGMEIMKSIFGWKLSLQFKSVVKKFI